MFRIRRLCVILGHIFQASTKPTGNGLYFLMTEKSQQSTTGRSGPNYDENYKNVKPEDIETWQIGGRSLKAVGQVYEALHVELPPFWTHTNGWRFSPMFFGLEMYHNQYEKNSKILGTLETTCDVLQRTFGRSTSAYGESDWRWEVCFADGQLAEIYNWKNGPTFDKKFCNVTANDISEWRVGGSSDGVLLKVCNALGLDLDQIKKTCL
eukprot:622075_1